MKTYLLLTTLFLLSFTQLYANNVDSLIRIDYLNIRKVLEKNPNQGLKLLKSFQAKDDEPLRKGLSECLFGMYYFESNIAKAEQHFKNANKIFSQTNDKKGRFTAQMGIANISFMNQRYDEALKNYLKVLKQLDSTNNEDRYNIANIHNNIASLYRIQKSFDKSTIYYQKALKGYEFAKDTNGIALVTLKLGNNLFDQYQFKKAKKYFLKALELAKLSEDYTNQSRILTKIGDIHFTMNDFNTALKHYQSAVQAAISSGASCTQLDGLSAQASALNKLKRFSEAEKIAQNAITICHECSMDLMLQDVYKQLAIAQFGQNKFDLATKNLGISDSLKYNQTVNDIRAESEKLEVKYRTAEKDNEILKNKMNHAKQDQKIAKQKQIIWLTFGLSAIVILSLIPFFVLWKKQKKINAEIKRINEFDNLLYSIIGHDLRHSIYAINYLDNKAEIEQSTKNTLLVLDGLLEWRSKSKNTQSIVSFERIFDELQDEFESELNRKKLVLKTEYITLPELQGDENAVKTIIRNIFSNAIKYSEYNSTIEISGDVKNITLSNVVDTNSTQGTKIGHTIIDALSEKNKLDFTFKLDNSIATSILKLRA
jgi:tetratricopeptide (TPR) repeat protein